MDDSEGELTRAEALDRIRRIRRELGHVRPEPTVAEVAASIPEPTVAEVAASIPEPTPVPPEVASLEALQRRYEMELAAHRDTTTALLAEKDRTIAKLEQLVVELRRQRLGEGLADR